MKDAFPFLPHSPHCKLAGGGAVKGEEGNKWLLGQTPAVWQRLEQMARVASLGCLKFKERRMAGISHYNQPPSPNPGPDDFVCRRFKFITGSRIGAELFA